MRQITKQVINAFLNRKSKTVSNTSTNGNELFLHGNRIAEWRNNELWITNAGWFSSTTKERLNGLPDVHIWQEDGEWYLNHAKWDGKWTKV